MAHEKITMMTRRMAVDHSAARAVEMRDSTHQDDLCAEKGTNDIKVDKNGPAKTIKL